MNDKLSVDLELRGDTLPAMCLLCVLVTKMMQADCNGQQTIEARNITQLETETVPCGDSVSQEACYLSFQPCSHVHP